MFSNAFKSWTIKRSCVPIPNAFLTTKSSAKELSRIELRAIPAYTNTSIVLKPSSTALTTTKNESIKPKTTTPSRF